MPTFTTVLHEEEDIYVAECLKVGTVSQGKTLEEPINNLKEATRLYLEQFPLKEEGKSLITTFEASIVRTWKSLRKECS